MEVLGLSQCDFRQIIRACQRVLINEATSTDDLKHFLVARLHDEFPQAAEQIRGLDDRQMELLRQEIDQTVKAGVGSDLW